MRDKVLRFMKEKKLLEENRTILIGVSGGPDSMALLHLLHAIQSTYCLRLIAVTIDHQLRGKQSAEDVAYVKAFCDRKKIKCVTINIDVASYQKQYKVGTQIAARTLRYEQFKRLAEQFEAHYIALGHHGDDQIETMIMALARSTQLHALNGMPVKRAFGATQIIRPLLCVTKEEIEQYCEAHQLAPRIDPSNEETYYTRNDVRANVIPLLKKRNPNLHVTAQTLSETLTDDEQLLMELAKKKAKQMVQFKENKRQVTFSAQSFIVQPVSLQRRIFRLILNYLYDTLPEQLSYIHERIFLTLLTNQTPNQVVHFPKQLHIERSYDDVTLYFSKKTVSKLAGFHAKVKDIPCSITLPNGKVLTMEKVDDLFSSSDHTYIFTKEQVLFPLHIRTRKPGDRVRWEGLRGSKKIKDLFIDEKIPRTKRDEIIIVADSNDEILWVLDVKQGKLQTDMGTGPYIAITYD